MTLRELRETMKEMKMTKKEQMMCLLRIAFTKIEEDDLMEVEYYFHSSKTDEILRLVKNK